MAALWHLPVIYACENNGYSEYTATAEIAAGSILARAEAFGIEAFQVDGQDVLAVNDLAAQLVARCRKGEGPFFIELLTYRYHGHHVGDINRDYYRPKEEEKIWKESRDPIVNFGTWLAERGHRLAMTSFGRSAPRSRPRPRPPSPMRWTLPIPTPPRSRLHVFAPNDAA